MAKETMSRPPQCPSCHDEMSLQGIEKKGGGRKLEMYHCDPCHQRSEQVINAEGKKLIQG